MSVTGTALAGLRACLDQDKQLFWERIRNEFGVRVLDGAKLESALKNLPR